MKTIITLLLLFILASGFPAFAADQDLLLKELQQHGARLRSTWSDLLGKDAKDRVQPAPEIVIDYLRKDNELNDYKERPHKAKVDPSFLEDIHAAIDELPEIVKKHIKEHVVAVFLVQELGTTGYGELLKDFDENRLGFIVLDVDFLNKKANDWISWRENSTFSGKGAYTIKAEIELEENDSRKSAIQYILLHEVGHLVGVAKGAHPSWFVGDDPQKWPFARLSWLTHKTVLKGESKYDDFFRTRKELKFYAFQNAVLSSDAIGETYEELSRTDFVSLYAATNMYDDFAESYTMYVHVNLQNKPWIVRVMREGKIVREIREPILETRFIKKKEYMDKLFKE
ncbi:MAG: hypothetical protein WC560_07985 [Syntrophales bacterium]